jgi:hypothetical protein
MPGDDMQKELDRIAGALEVLDLLRERLELQRDEIAGESGLEVLDETLSHVSSLLTEYRRRRKELHPHHKPYLFLLTESHEVKPLAYERFAALAHGELAALELAERRVRLADWYVRMEGPAPGEVVNEAYQWLVFDAKGRMDLHAAHAIEGTPLPSEAERMQIRTLVFATA